MFLGGDCADHGSEWRPTQYVSLPKDIRPSPLPVLYPETCPGSAFASIHRFRREGVSPEDDIDALTHPFCFPIEEASYNVEEARQSVEYLSEFDAHEDILVMIAHDSSMLEVVDFFPEGTANAWKQKGWREKGMWRFLADFTVAVKEQIESETIDEFRRAEAIVR